MMNWRRRYQALKKYLGVVYLWRKFGCRTTWVMDSESFPFKRFTFHSIMDFFHHNRSIFVPAAMAESIARCKVTNSSSGLTISSGSSQSASGVSGHRSANWDDYFFKLFGVKSECSALRFYSRDDFWLYDGRVMNHMVKHLQSIHFPRSFVNLVISFENGWTGEYFAYAEWIRLHVIDPRSPKLYHDFKFSSMT
jgi:hypothetical protein